MPLFLPPAEFEGGESWVLGSSLDSVYGGMQCVKTDNKVWEKPNKVHNCDLCPGKWDDPSGAWRLNLAWLTWFWPCLVSGEQKWPQRRAQPGVGAVLPLPWPCPWSSSVCKGDATALPGPGSGCTQPSLVGNARADDHSSLTHRVQSHCSGARWLWTSTKKVGIGLVTE